MHPARRSSFDGHAEDVCPFSFSDVSKNLKHMEYAVRGQVVLRANEVARAIKKRKEEGGSEAGDTYPFDTVYYANIGNPQAVGQIPLTFPRQVLSCLLNPSLMDTMDALHASGVKPANDAPGLYPKDVLERSRRYLKEIRSMGAYTHSKGASVFRNAVSRFLTARDGVQTDPEHVFLGNGASGVIRLVLQLLIASKGDGIMIPTPQYPLYSASIVEFRGKPVPYFLQEEDGWGVDLASLTEVVNTARAYDITMRALVVINPGNPTGSVLSRSAMEAIVHFCEHEGLALIADEVYQRNIYTEKTFIPFRKLAVEMKSTIQVYSFHSCSKGMMGECGFRGGFVHMHNVPDDLLDIFYKMASVSLCSCTPGQAMVSVLVDPPEKGTESYDLFNKEEQDILSALKRKAVFVAESLNQIEGISCQPVEGAMYAFPRITLPEKFCEKAAQMKMQPDMLYCISMVEQIGVVTVPGSGFGQAHGTHHFRITILPTEAELRVMLKKIATFHEGIVKAHS